MIVPIRGFVQGARGSRTIVFRLYGFLKKLLKTVHCDRNPVKWHKSPYKWRKKPYETYGQNSTLLTKTKVVKNRGPTVLSETLANSEGRLDCALQFSQCLLMLTAWVYALVSLLAAREKVTFLNLCGKWLH